MLHFELKGLITCYTVNFPHCTTKMIIVCAAVCEM